MAADPGFIFYPGDYLRDTQCLSEKSQVAYDRILCEHMRNICISQQQLKFFTKRLNEDEKDELMMVLTFSDGGYFINWVVESIKKRREYSESRRNNRSKTNKKTESVNNNISITYDKHMDNENEIINEDKNVFVNEELKAKKNELTVLLCEKFGYSEMRFANKQREISAFVSVKILNDQDYDNFILQFTSYDQYKILSEEKRHAPEKLIGSQAEQFNDSVLLSENWEARLINFKQQKPKTKFDKVADNHFSDNPYLNKS